MVRARVLRRLPPVGPVPDFGLYLLGRQPRQVPRPSRWVRWGDFRLPADEADAREASVESWHRALTERVEVACGGGRGRTGTALACPAVLDGVPARHAVAWVRRSYDPRAVETPWQRRWVMRFELA